MIEVAKQVSEVGAFGLVVLMILMAVKVGPRVLDLWTRGVVAMERIADDMKDHQSEMRQTRETLTAHSSEVHGHVTAIRGDIAGVRQDVLRVEGKVERLVR